MASRRVQACANVRHAGERMRVILTLWMCTALTVLGAEPTEEQSENDVHKPCDVLYREGVEAYLEERWQDCVDNLELAVTKYRSYKQAVVNCRLKCHAEAEAAPLIVTKNIDDLHYYEKMVKKTLCLLKCKKQHSEDMPSYIPRNIENEFEEMKPYEYLQLCYFQRGMLQEAASAVFTFLVVNPKHQVMEQNLQYYSKLPEVNMEQLVNHEAKNYVSLYVHGSEAYRKEDYKAVISYIEESLEDYLRSLDECRAYCEGPFDQGWFPDFTSSIANHFTFCLKCKQRCPEKLNSLNGEQHADLLSSHYHYLQFAYYKVGNLKKACEATASYLLFFPYDETMLNNKKYYSKLPKVQDHYFTPREEAVRYVQREESEQKLLHFIETEFVFQDIKENEIHNSQSEGTQANNSKISSDLQLKFRLSPPPVVRFEWPKYNITLPSEENTVMSSVKNDVAIKNYENMEDLESEKRSLREKKQRAIQQIQRAAARNIKVIQGEKELKGKFRFLADGVANKSECEMLMELAQIAAVQGDGYRGNKSPHTDLEKFEGVTLGRAALLVYFGLMELNILELYLNLSEIGRDFVERYFNLKNELYFTYTHLVCRSALPNCSANRTDMSHNVHADNCNLLENGNCTKSPPSYTWRDFSAIIYLNEEFEGGEFIFASDISAKNIQSMVKPKCGRLVGFSAGPENLHGVLAVRKGRRCALGLWFTFDSYYQEIERVLAQQVLLEVKQRGTISEQLLNEIRKHVSFEIPSTKAAVASTSNHIQDILKKEVIGPPQKTENILSSKSQESAIIQNHQHDRVLSLA